MSKLGNKYSAWGTATEQKITKERFRERDDADKSCADYTVLSANGQRPSAFVVEGNFAAHEAGATGAEWLQSDEIEAPGVIGQSEQDKFLAGWKDK